MGLLGWILDERRAARREATERELHRQMMALDGDPLWDEAGDEDGDD